MLPQKRSQYTVKTCFDPVLDGNSSGFWQQVKPYRIIWEVRHKLGPDDYSDFVINSPICGPSKSIIYCLIHVEMGQSLEVFVSAFDALMLMSHIDVRLWNCICSASKRHTVTIVCGFPCNWASHKISHQSYKYFSTAYECRRHRWYMRKFR